MRAAVMSVQQPCTCDSMSFFKVLALMESGQGKFVNPTRQHANGLGGREGLPAEWSSEPLISTSYNQRKEVGGRVADRRCEEDIQIWHWMQNVVYGWLRRAIRTIELHLPESSMFGLK